MGGGASYAFADAIERGGAIYHPMGHEGAATIAAAACWKVGGLPTATITIKGPGLANAVPGIAHSALERQACLTIAEAYDATSTRWHKRLDHVAALAPLVKYHAGVDEIDHVDRLVALARAEAPGPVHLDLGRLPTRASSPPHRSHGERASAEGLDVSESIARPRRPLVIVGGLASRRAWGSSLTNLQVPVLTTLAAKGVVDEHMPFAGGVFTGDGRSRAPETALLEACDLVVGLGLRAEEVLTPGAGRPAVLLDEIPLPPGFAGGVGVAEAEDTVWTESLVALSKCSWGDDLVAAARRRLNAVLDTPGWWPGACFRVLDERVREELLVVDTGLFCTLAEHRYLASPERPFLASANGRYMGTSIPMAIGAAVATRQPVICVVGDGGMAGYPAELRVAAAERLALCVLLVRDGVFSSVLASPTARGRSARPATVPEGSWWRAIEGLGIPSRVVQGEGDLDDALATWGGVGPTFLECAFDADWDRSRLEEVR